jgi:hypothetical protein
VGLGNIFQGMDARTLVGKPIDTKLDTSIGFPTNSQSDGKW